MVFQPVGAVAAVIYPVIVLWGMGWLFGAFSMGFGFFIAIPVCAIVTPIIISGSVSLILFTYPISLAITPMVWYCFSPVVYLCVWVIRSSTFSPTLKDSPEFHLFYTQLQKRSKLYVLVHGLFCMISKIQLIVVEKVLGRKMKIAEEPSAVQVDPCRSILSKEAQPKDEDT
jgi:hypothetical protein